MNEAQRERRFRDLVNGMGCHVVKYQDPGLDGGPDRLVLTPVGVPIWVEFKDLGEAPRHHQTEYAAKLMNLGFLAIWANDPDRAADFVALVIASNDPHRFVQMTINGQKVQT